MSSVFLAVSARTDLLEIWSFIAEESFDAADHVMDLIEKESQTLALGAGPRHPHTTCTTYLVKMGLP